ncbi:Ig-like domain-containing protein [Nocardioides sp. R-C-SC26]|uniref:Ig-like domain-containing protein n=1 Tax=Nocardioides sp. R-C-SC26 TaxID=2870414 RepID=UPI001E5A211A|nr:Ig-like domain-containing protein [Nocardioides sp. R-C-SC26]
MRKFLHPVLAGLVAAAGALVVTGIGAAVAPTAQAAPPTISCAALPASSYRQTTIGQGLGVPVGIDVDAAGVVHVVDALGVVFRLTPEGSAYTSTSAPSDLPPFSVGGFALGADGLTYIADTQSGTVEKLTFSNSSYALATVASGLGRLPALDVDGAGIVYAGGAGRQLLKLAPNGGGYSQTALQPTAADITGLAVASASTVYVTLANNVVQALSTNGAALSTLPTDGLSSPGGLDAEPGGTRIFVVDTGNDRIVVLRWNGDGFVQETIPTTGLLAPRDIAVDDQGRLYVADTDNNRVVRLDPVSVTADADTASTTLGNAVATDVRTNDTATGSTLAEPTIAENPKHGTATVNANGTITYTPDAGFSGTDTYSYAVRDAAGVACATAEVTVTVTQGNACDPLGTFGADIPLPIETGTDYPQSFDVDSDGSIFLTDSETDQIVRLTPTASGYDRSVVASGLGGTGSIAVDDSDASGAIWVVRYSANQVLRLVPSGSSYSLAGTFTSPLLVNIGGIDVAPNGDVFVSTNATSYGSGGVVRLDKSASYAASPSMATGLQFPHQVTVDDAGAVYVASYTRVVKLVDTGSGWAQTNAVSGLGSGQGVAVDHDGTLWVSTSEDPGVWTVTPSGSGYGPKQLHAPWGTEYATTLKIGEDGSLFVSSFDALWTFGPTTLRTTDDTATTTAPGSVTTDVRANDAANVRLGAPTVISAPANGTATVNADGTITYAPDAGFSGTDTYRYLVRDDENPARVCGIATVTITVTSETDCGAIPASAYLSRAAVMTLQEPTGIVSDANNTIWAGDAGSGMVFIGWPGSNYTPNGIDSADRIDPQGIAMDAVGAVYYADEGNHEIVKLTQPNRYTWARTVLAGNLQRPSGIAVDVDGNVYFSENSSGDVHKLTPSDGGYTTSLVGSGLERPRGVAVDADGNVFVADWADEDKIVRFSPSGAGYTRSVVALGLANPHGVVEADGTLIVGDSGNKRVLRLVPNGTGYAQETLTVWGTATPTWVATMASGDLLVTDRDAQQVVALRKRTLSAQDDTATTTVQTAVTADVRSNDTIAPASPAMSAPTVIGTPAGGTATVGTDGQITYTPSAGFSGVDVVEYRVDDATVANICATARLSVTVQNVFAPGTGVMVFQNTPITTPLSAIATTTGRPLDATQVVAVTQPDHGAIAISATTGAVTYTPDPGHIGADSYSVRVCDTSAPVQCADVAVPVTVVAPPPVDPGGPGGPGGPVIRAEDDTSTTQVATAVRTDVVRNDAAASGVPLSTPTVVSPPSHGTVTAVPDGFEYTPGPGFSGVDTFTYQVCAAATSACDTATVSITVRNGFTPGPSQVTTPNSPSTVGLSDLVTTDGRPLDPSSVVVVTEPRGGSVAIDAVTGAVTYLPDPGFVGPDEYVIRVCDTSVPVQCADIRLTVTVGAPSQVGPRLRVRAPKRIVLPVSRAGEPAEVATAATVVVSGYGSARAGRATATLYGPAPRRTSRMCTPSARVARVAFPLRNGRITTPRVVVSKPGHHTWVVTTAADSRNRAAGTPCGAKAAGTLAHRPRLPALRVTTGSVRNGRPSGMQARMGTVAIPSVGVRVRVDPVGRRGKTMFVPGRRDRAGWLVSSAAPGERVGATVIAGQVAARGRGALTALRRVRSGQVVTVRADGIGVRRYRITRVETRVRSRSLPGPSTSTSGIHRLTLVTKAGAGPSRGVRARYLIVTAMPVAGPGGGAAAR